MPCARAPPRVTPAETARPHLARRRLLNLFGLAKRANILKKGIVQKKILIEQKYITFNTNGRSLVAIFIFKKKSCSIIICFVSFSLFFCVCCYIVSLFQNGARYRAVFYIERQSFVSSKKNNVTRAPVDDFVLTNSAACCRRIVASLYRRKSRLSEGERERDTVRE